MDKPNGGAAFPRPAVAVTAESGDVSIVEGQDGMSLRDYLAANALAGMLVHGTAFESPAQTAGWAYQFADAMLAVRGRE